MERLYQFGLWYSILMALDQRVLITGATSGLGREMAVQLGKRGWHVALTGRREDKLREARLDTDAPGSWLVQF